MSQASHRKCGFCKGVVPVQETECPYCGKSLESAGAIGRFIDALLPQDRPMTKLMTGLAVAMYALVGLTAGGSALASPSTYSLIHFGAMFPPYVLDGQVWRLMTAVFLHGDIIHIAFNLYALWLLGPLIENSFGKTRFLIIFVVTGLISTMASFGWGFVWAEIAPQLGMNVDMGGVMLRTSVGMSGALTGLIGVGVSAGHRVKTAQGAVIRDTMLRWMLFILIFGLAVPQVDNAAHIGGFIPGLALGALLPLRDRASYAAGIGYSVGAALCAVAIVGGIAAQIISMPLDMPPDSAMYPTSIFGQKLRERDTEDRDFLAAARACDSALNQMHQGKVESTELKALTDVARVNCDMANYIQPFTPTGYWASAFAHYIDGDGDTACRKLRTAHLIQTYEPALYNEELARDIEALDNQLKCP